jgi:hypothetical protein
MCTVYGAESNSWVLVGYTRDGERSAGFDSVYSTWRDAAGVYRRDRLGWEGCSLMRGKSDFKIA